MFSTIRKGIAPSVAADGLMTGSSATSITIDAALVSVRAAMFV
jgi:hypothetical protein